MTHSIAKYATIPFLVVSLVGAPALCAQNSYPFNRLEYQKRVNRFEGIYLKQKTFAVVPEKENDDFAVVCFTIGKFYFNKQQHEIIQVRSKSNTEIIGKSTLNDISYKYRLDGSIRGHLSTLEVPVDDVIIHLDQLDFQTIGIFGYKKITDTYLPVISSVRPSRIKNDTLLRIFVTPRAIVENIKWRVLKEDGANTKTSQWTNYIDPAHQTIVRPGFTMMIALPPLSGLCILEIQATLRDNGTILKDEIRIEIAGNEEMTTHDQ